MVPSFIRSLSAVVAVAAIGLGVVASPAAASDPPPDAPTVTQVTPGDGALTLAFTPGSDNGNPITGYEYTLDGGTTWVPAGATSPITIGGLVNGTTYSVHLRALSLVGAGPMSETATGTPCCGPMPDIVLPPVAPPSPSPAPPATAVPHWSQGPLAVLLPQIMNSVAAIAGDDEDSVVAFFDHEEEALVEVPLPPDAPRTPGLLATAVSTTESVAVTPEGGFVTTNPAHFFGSIPLSLSLRAPVIDVAVNFEPADTPTPNWTPTGYWLAGGDGGVFTFGSAGFHGSAAGLPLRRPIVSVIPAPDGYWLLGADGGVFAFGGAGFFGSIGGQELPTTVVSLVPTITNQGYWIVGADGSVHAFGDAAPIQGPTEPTFVITAMPAMDSGLLIVTDGLEILPLPAAG